MELLDRWSEYGFQYSPPGILEVKWRVSGKREWLAMQMLLRDEDEAWDLIIGFGNVEDIDLNKSEYVKWWRQKLFGVGSKKNWRWDSGDSEYILFSKSFAIKRNKEIGQ